MADRYDDRVVPFVYGYLCGDWFGKAPEKELQGKEITDFGEEFQKYDLSCGITSYVYQNGIILFDFFSCKLCPVLVHRESCYKLIETDENGSLFECSPEEAANLEVGYRREVVDAQTRIAVLNTHRNVYVAIPKPGRGTVETRNSKVVYSGSEILDSRIYIGWDVGKYEIHQDVTKSTRAAVPWPVVRKSMEALDEILNHGTKDLFKIIDALSRASFLLRDGKLEQSLLYSWVVCERLLNHLWDNLVETSSRSEDGSVLRDRIKRLRGISYTASVKLEVLELTGRLSRHLLAEITNIRKKRNHWLHGMKTVETEDASRAIKASRDLLNTIFDLKLPFSLGASYGGSGMEREKFEREYPDRSLPAR